MSRYVEQLDDGRFVIASWVSRAGAWHDVTLAIPTERTAVTLERLVEAGAQVYATREDAERVARELP